jgi:glycosyltransferase involved in cell wall biosynthesis
MNITHKEKVDIEFFFVGTAVSQQLCESTLGGVVSGNKFQLGFVTGLEKLSKNRIKVISLLPSSLYPKVKKIWFKADWCLLSDKSKAFLVPFINLPIINYLTAAISIFSALVCGLWSNRSNLCIVLVYNVFSPFSLPVLAASKLFGCKSVAIIADLPFDLYDFKGWKGIFHRIDFFIQTRIISMFSGVITLTPKIIEDFSPLLPSIIIEGGIDTKVIKPAPVSPKKPEHFICLYCGALNEINGISLLLESFALITNSEFRLWIFGEGPLSTIVKDAAAIDKRIVYWGKISNDQVMTYQREATVLINPRPSSNKITYYTFPSKLLEYMLSGRPVISTRLSGIPKDYYDHLIFLEKETPEDLAKLIKEVCLGEAYDIDTIGIKAKEFIESTKSWEYQSKLIYDFLSTL